MKKIILEFVKRGLMASVGGPIVLAIVYGILGNTGVIDTLTPSEVTIGILTAALLAFIAAGITVVYNIEKLSLMAAIFIHGIILYLDYILIYLFNGWLKSGIVPILIFTGIFITGYTIVWMGIYFSIKNKADNINKKLSTN